MQSGLTLDQNWFKFWLYRGHWNWILVGLIYILCFDREPNQMILTLRNSHKGRTGLHRGQDLKRIKAAVLDFVQKNCFCTQFAQQKWKMGRAYPKISNSAYDVPLSMYLQICISIQPKFNSNVFVYWKKCHPPFSSLCHQYCHMCVLNVYKLIHSLILPVTFICTTVLTRLTACY